MNNKIKKPVLFLLCLSATLATLTACGKKTTKNTTIPTPTTTTQRTTTKKPPTGNPRVIFIVDGEIYQEVEYTKGTAAIVEPEIPQKTGYNKAVWSSYELNGYDLYSFAIYYKSNTTYKVQYHLQNLENDDYTIKEEDTQSFTTTPDKIITPDINTYDGFKCINTETEYALDEDPTKNVINIYYDRIKYDINIDLDNGTSNLEYSLKYGATIPTIATPIKEGYEFTKFTSNGADIDLTKPVSQSLNIKANYAANTNTAYTVKYYQENLYDDGYTLVSDDTEEKSGTTDTDVSVTVDPNKYTGFTVNQEKTVSSGKILGDGSLELAIYYKRNTYTVTYKYADGVTSDVVETLKYGAKATNKSVLREGYSFDGWVDLSTSNLFNFDNIISKDYILNASYTPSSGTAYKVNVYFENANNNEYTLDYTYTYSATTGKEVSVNINDYIENCFEFNAEMSNASGIVQADGSLLLNLYFKRKVYTLTFIDGTTSGLIKVVEIKHGCIPSQMPEEFTRVGYNLSLFVDQTLGGGQSTYSELLNFIYSYNGSWGYAHSVKITYVAKTDIVYKVRLYLENVEDDGYTFSEELTFTGKTGDAINPQSINYFTFDHASGYTEEDGAIIKGDGSTVIKAYYNRNKYNIYFDSGIDDVSIDPIENIKYGSRISVPSLEKAGYSIDEWWGDYHGTLDLDNYRVDCDETIYCRWIANTNTKYKVKHYVQNIDDDEYTLYQEEFKEGTTDQYAYYYDQKINIEGCSYYNYDKYSIQIAGDGSSEISLYYNRYSYYVTVRLDSRLTVQIDSNSINGKEQTTYSTPFRYGKKIKLKALLNNILGYEYDGFYNYYDDELITSNDEYEFTITDTSVDVRVKTKVIEELENFNFTSDETNLKITSVKEMPEILTIPDIVTEIGQIAYNNQTIRELHIGKNVKTMSSGAFYNCENLEVVTFDSNSKLEAISRVAFAYTNITNITIPNSVKLIDDEAFRNSSLANITFAENSNLETIGSSAFYDSNIKEITLPSSIKEIQTNAFNTLRMDEFVIPASLETIGEYAFSECKFDVLRFEENENRTKITNSAFYYIQIKKIIIPKDVKEIEDYAFSSTRVEEIEFEEGSILETIGIQSFHENRLKYLELPDNLKLIKEQAFYNYGYKMSYVNVNSKLLEIENDAFYGVFPNIILNHSEKTFVIGEDTYGQIANNASYIFNGEEISHILINDGFVYNIYDDEKELLAYIGDDREIIIPNNVTKIRDNAFYDNDKIVKVIIPDNVTSIGKNAFRGCDCLASVTIGSGLTEILSNAFYDCGNLVEVINNSSIEIIKNESSYGYIGYYALNIVTDGSNSSVEIDNDLFVKYTLDDKVYLIKYIGEELEEVIIPEAYTNIYNKAFRYDSYLKKVTIGSGIKEIGNYAFQGNSYLNEIIFGDNTSVEIIGNYAFADINNDKFTSLFIPNTVKEIKNCAFYNCSHLENIIFEDDSILEYIGEQAFYNIGIKQLVLPDSLVTLDDDAFYNCSSLEEVYLGTNLTTIGNSAFAYNYNLKEVTNNSENLEVIDEYAFAYCYRLTEFTLNETVTGIYTDAFNGANIISIYNKSSLLLEKGSSLYGQIALKALDIYSNIDDKKIYTDENGFAYYEDGDDLYLVAYTGSDEDIVISKDVTIIANSAFYNNSTVKNISFEDDSKLRIIKEYAFYNTNLETLELPSSLEQVEKQAYLYVNNDAYYTYENGCYYLGNESNPYLYLAYIDSDDITINSSCKIIGENVFNWWEIDELVIPDSVIFICNNAFSYATINSLTLSENISIINEYTFASSNIENITIPKNVKIIDTYAFNDSQITTLTFEDDSLLEEIKDYAFYNCDNLTSIILPSTLKVIGNNAFYSCEALEEITLSSSLELIGDSAFEYCSSLTSINIPNNVEIIGSRAFRYCSSLATLTFEDNSNLIVIGENVFRNTMITEIVFPDSLEEIGAYAFYNLQTLTSIEFGVDSNLKAIDEYAFYQTAITELVLPKSLDTIWKDAFYNCDYLTSITVATESNLSEIGDYAFYNCDLLETIDLSNATQLKEIGYCAFSNCRNVKTIILPEGIEEIGKNAFNYTFLGSSEGEQKLYLPKSLKKVESYAFYCTYNLTDIYYAGTIEDWLDIDFVDYSSNPLNYTSINFHIWNSETSEYDLLTDIVIPDSVTSIRDYAFASIKNIKTILLPTSITEIGGSSFNSIGSVKYYYLGTPEEFSEKGLASIIGTNYTYFYSETEPVDTTYYYWHYVDGKITEYKFEEAKAILEELVDAIEFHLEAAYSGDNTYIGSNPNTCIIEEVGVSYTVSFDAIVYILNDSGETELYQKVANYAYLINFSAQLDVATNKITYSFDEESSEILGYYLEIDDEGNLILIQ